MRTQTRATLYALATVAIWSTVASAFKLSLRHVSVTGLLLYASAISLITLLTILTFQGQISALLRTGRSDLMKSALYGFLNPFAYYLILFKAYDLLPAQEAQPLNYTWAITLSLLAVPLLKQKLRLIDLLALVVSYCGVLVIATRGDVLGLQFSNPAGVLLALGSTVVWALYWILNTRDPLDPVLRLCANFFFGTLYVALFALLSGGLELPPLPGLAGALYVGVFEMGVTFVLWLTALKLTNSTARISILIYLSPFLSLLLIHHLVGETILPSTITGLVLIMAGIGLQQMKKGGLKTEG